MNEAKLWRILDRAREKSGGDTRLQIEALGESLGKLQATELLEFQRLLYGLRNLVFTKELFAVVLAPSQFFDAFSFSDFQDWLLLRGKKAAKAAIKNPDSLAELFDQNEITAAAKLHGTIEGVRKKFGSQTAPATPPKLDFEKVHGNLADPLMNGLMFAALATKVKAPKTLARFWPSQQWERPNIPFAGKDVARAMAKIGNAYGAFMYASFILAENETPTPSQIEEAKRWLVFAGENGSKDAAKTLATAYEEELFGKDPEAAARWAFASEILGDPESDNLLKESRDATVLFSMSLLEKDAERGNAKAAQKVAEFYFKGRVFKQDFAKARKFFELAASAGVIEAWNYLGHLWEHGKGGPASLEKAAEYYRHGAGQNDRNSMNNLALLLIDGRGLAKQPEEAQRLFMAAAMAGSVDAQYNLGLHLARGSFGKADLPTACDWYEQAAEASHTRAQCNIGMAYLHGQGRSQDHEKAVHWFQRGARQGHAVSMINLGHCYYSGKGAPRDYAKAVDLFTKARDAHPMALVNLADCFEHGNGVPQDYAEALRLLMEAADKGSSLAVAELGKFHEQGLGTKKDLKKARAYYEKAAAKGEAAAIEALKRLES